MAIGYRYSATITDLDGKSIGVIRYRAVSVAAVSSDLSWSGRMNSSQTLTVATIDSLPEIVEKSPGNYRIRVRDKTYLIQTMQKHEITPIASVLTRRYETILALR